MMNAIRIHRYGGPEVLTYEPVPRPTPQGDDVLVRVHAAGVNPVDWKVRQGYAKDWQKHTLPLILGWDVSGVVELAGPDATAFLPGEEVFSRPDIGRDGAYADYMLVRASELARKPASIDHLHAAAVPLAALTAWQSLFDAARLAAGQRVLIHAAAGGVGHFAVQLAKWKGAEVIATASGPHHALLAKLGADRIVDYGAEPFENAARDVDVVLDTIGGDTQERSWRALRHEGTLVSIVSPPPERRNGARGRFVFVQPNAGQLQRIAELIDAGRVTPVVERVFPLAEARKAHELIEQGHVGGKLVLRVAG